MAHQISICQECETGYTRTDGTHAVVQAPGPQPPLRDLKSAALPQQHVAGGHAHALRVMSCIQALVLAATAQYVRTLPGSQPH